MGGGRPGELGAPLPALNGGPFSLPEELGLLLNDPRGALGGPIVIG